MFQTTVLQELDLVGNTMVTSQLQHVQQNGWLILFRWSRNAIQRSTWAEMVAEGRSIPTKKTPYDVIIVCFLFNRR